MGRRRCCCNECMLLEDDFARSDSTSLGGDWSEETGDSEIISGELVVPAGGVVVTVAETGLSDPWMRTTVDCVDPQIGKTFRAIVNYEDLGSDSYYYAELKCLAGSVATLTIGECSSGADQELKSTSITYTAGVTETLVACRTIEGLYGSANVTTYVWDCVADNGGRRGGVANESSSSVEFDNFECLRGAGTDGILSDDRCFLCQCECQGNCLRDCLVMTFDVTDPAAADSTCYCLDGDTVDLALQPGDNPVWYGEEVLDDWTCTTASTGAYSLECADNPEDFVLWTNGHPSVTGWTSGGTGPNGESLYALPSSYSCDPFVLTYGPFTRSMSAPCDPCDCEFYLVITEASSDGCMELVGAGISNSPISSSPISGMR